MTTQSLQGAAQWRTPYNTGGGGGVQLSPWSPHASSTPFVSAYTCSSPQPPHIHSSPPAGFIVTDIRIFVTIIGNEDQVSQVCIRVPPECPTIGDLQAHIRECLGVEQDVQLYIGTAFIPASESTKVLREGDNVRVQPLAETRTTTKKKSSKVEKKLKKSSSSKPKSEKHQETAKQKPKKSTKRKRSREEDESTRKATETTEQASTTTDGTEECAIRTMHDGDIARLNVRDPASGWKARQEGLRQKALHREATKKAARKQKKAKKAIESADDTEERPETSSGGIIAQSSQQDCDHGGATSTISATPQPSGLVSNQVSRSVQDQVEVSSALSVTTEPAQNPIQNHGSSTTAPQNGQTERTQNTSQGGGEQTDADEESVTYMDHRSISEPPQRGDMISYQELKLHHTQNVPQISRLYAGLVESVEQSPNETVVKLKGYHVHSPTDTTISLRRIKTQKSFEVIWENVYNPKLWDGPSKALDQKNTEGSAASSKDAASNRGDSKAAETTTRKSQRVRTKHNNGGRGFSQAARFGRRSLGVSQLLNAFQQGAAPAPS
eukprot:gb/GECG01010058.1/.p1 GENE.gb/GECG01010058.1/~~gb/GECG01010058.1/.p1  ORF type:complete len:552 (+),score=76.32 gb/GECG01010058.1/:1-1656(+)